MATNLVEIGRAGAARGTCVFGERTRIIAPMIGASLDALRAEVDQARTLPVDMLEWRVDALLAELKDIGFGHDGSRNIALRAWNEVVSLSPVPVLATVRTRAEGGLVDLSEKEYGDFMRALAQKADAVDVEISRESSEDIVKDAHELGARVLASFHDVEATPHSYRLEETIFKMSRYGADVLKVACTPRVPADTARLFRLLAAMSEMLTEPLIVIGMGALGGLTRFAGMQLGNAATFASLQRASAPGQFSVTDTRAVLDLSDQ